MSLKNIFCLALVLTLGTATLQAQTPATKYGHMNLGNLLDQMPATKTANDSLKVFADVLTAKGDSMAMAFQKAYALLEKEYSEGSLTPIQAAERQKVLEQDQAKIQAFEQDAQQALDAKRQELLTPILTQLDTALREVAKENGYLMIFDVSTGAMLFADEADDVTPLVKKKLGLQ